MKLKQFLTLLLSLLFLIALAGCGKNTDSASSKKSNSKTASESASADENSENTDSEKTDSDAENNSGSSSKKSGSATSTAAGSSSSKVSNHITNLNGRTIKLHIGQVEAESSSEVGVKFAALIKKLNETYNCNIEYYVSYDWDSINASIASGKPSVDILWSNGYTMFLNAYNAGYLQPLEPLGGINFNDKTRFAEISDAAIIKSEHYAVSPMYYCYGEMRTWFSFVMLYNKDMLKKAGINDDLYALQTSGKWTYAKFEEYALKLKNAGMNPLADVDGYLYKAMLYANNTDWISYDKKAEAATFTGNSTAAQKVLNSYTSYVTKGYITVPAVNGGPPPNKHTALLEQYVKGNTAFAVENGPWVLKWASGWDSKVKANTGLLLIPKQNESDPYRTRASADYAFWSIPYGVKNPAEVAFIINALNEPLFKEKDNLRILTTNMTPLINDLGSLETLKTLYQMGEPVLSYDYIANNPGVYYGASGWMTHVQKIANGQETQGSVLESVTDYYNKLLKDIYKVK